MLLRIGTQGRWLGRRAESDEDVAQAARDLTLREGEGGLSVYRVGGLEEARALALSWALEKRDRDDNADYIVFDEGLVAETHTLEARPDEDAVDAGLRERHHELVEQTAGAAKLLASKLLAGSDRRVERVPKAEVAAERRRRQGRGP
ncbi:MAG: hypothetical protein U0324_20470 [Polyangiales bacterium]